MIADPERLIGKRFSADFRVEAVGVQPYTEETLVVLYQHGERVELSLGELSALIESGFAVELPDMEGR